LDDLIHDLIEFNDAE